MNPDLDRQNKPRWPFPNHDALDRARHIGLMYRQRLRALDRAAADECDATAAQFGERWMLHTDVVTEAGQAVTTAEAAELAGVTEGTIRKWACLEHPEKPGEMLLPRFKKRGRDRTYLAEHVLAAASAMRRARAKT